MWLSCVRPGTVDDRRNRDTRPDGGVDDRGRCRLRIAVRRLPSSPGSAHHTFSITGSFPLVTLVTMVAPSPDWFVGVAGEPFCIGGRWIDRLVVDLWPYDAGTDAGASYGSPNADMNPADPISKISTLPLGNGEPLGTFTFQREGAIFTDGFESGDTSAWN